MAATWVYQDTGQGITAAALQADLHGNGGGKGAEAATASGPAHFAPPPAPSRWESARYAATAGLKARSHGGVESTPLRVHAAKVRDGGRPAPCFAAPHTLLIRSRPGQASGVPASTQRRALGEISTNRTHLQTPLPGEKAAVGGRSAKPAAAGLSLASAPLTAPMRHDIPEEPEYMAPGDGDIDTDQAELGQQLDRCAHSTSTAPHWRHLPPFPPHPLPSPPCSASTRHRHASASGLLQRFGARAPAHQPRHVGQGAAGGCVGWPLLRSHALSRCHAGVSR